MNDILKKILLFYKKFVGRNEVQKRSGINPVRDWFIILVISFVVFCFFAFFCYYFYSQIKQDKLFITTKTNEIKDLKISPDFLKKAIDDINLRRDTTEKLKNNNVVVPGDPSV